MEKRTLLLALLVPTFISNLLANPNDDKILNLKQISEAIQLDGFIESSWSQADSVSDFFQLRPFHGEKPSYKTVAKVLSTETSLFCLIKCYLPKENIQQKTGKLDDSGGDVVSIMLDTFGDQRTAYKFAVTATGVRSDARMLDDARNRDSSWDGIWFANSQIYDWGFVVEMEIPYKSIQYDENLSYWGLDFDRWITDKNEDLYWCAYEENEGQRVSKFGKLVFDNFRPSVKGLHLEIYPVGITKLTYLHDNKYKADPDAGIDIFYNPSPKLTLQLTANPDFAQIEADPFEFNISRYESYFSERRPFFVEGNEVFMASGKQRNTGFYQPLELFYSRRIGKKLPNGQEVPLLFGTKAFGRINNLEYGGFMALTGEEEYFDDGEKQVEDRAFFGSARFKKQIFKNSSIGFLFVGKNTNNEENGVLDIDGAFRGSNWQLAYQVARSYKNSEGDFAGSAGFTQFKGNWINFIKGRYVGDKFDIDQVGFVPWRGTWNTVGISGPRWYFETGTIRQILIYGGGILNYEKVDEFTDYGGVFGFNMQFRNNWGYEINLDMADSKDLDKRYNTYNVNISSWFHTSPRWIGNIDAGYSKTYNFSRDYLAFYSWIGGHFQWQATDVLEIGTSGNVFFEGNPDGNIEDITYNARPYFSTTPFNNLNIRVYVDNLYIRSSARMEQLILGFLFSYNFSPKSWIYFAINEIRDRSDQYDSVGNLKPKKLHVLDRVSVFKLKYLYYF